MNSDAATTTSSSTTTTTETAAAIASTGQQQAIAAQENNITNTVATNSLETAAARPDLRAVVSDNEPAKNERKEVGSYLFIKNFECIFL